MSDCALPLETEIEKIMFFIGGKVIENHQKEEDQKKHQKSVIKICKRER